MLLDHVRRDVAIPVASFAHPDLADRFADEVDRDGCAIGMLTVRPDMGCDLSKIGHAVCDIVLLYMSIARLLEVLIRPHVCLLYTSPSPRD